MYKCSGKDCINKAIGVSLLNGLPYCSKTCQPIGGGMGNIELAEGKTIMTLSGEGIEEQTPKIVTIQFKVEADGKSADDAKSTYQKRREILDENIAQFFAELKHILSPNDGLSGIKNDSFTVLPVYAYAPDQARRIAKYTASADITMVIADKDYADFFIDYVVLNHKEGDIGGTVESVSFHLDDHDDRLAKAVALGKAIKNARQKADMMAEMAGFKVEEILRIKDEGVTGGSTGGYRRSQSRSFEMASLSSSSPVAVSSISSGVIKYTGRVTLTVKLEPFAHNTRAGVEKQ